jgi:hypothetical protein
MAVNACPYRYSPQHKDEIERQVTAMLQAGVIVPSMSPFASPILLVQKKDNDWRFYIDYRLLNELTIKTHSPCPSLMSCWTNWQVPSYFPSRISA